MAGTGFAEWLSGSAFTDSVGRPLMLFHGTDSDLDFNVFCRAEESSIGYHFGDRSAAHARINGSLLASPGECRGAVIPVYCNARRPLRLVDHHTWVLRDICSELFDLDVINDDQWDFIEESCSENALFAALEVAGYDSVVYRNETEYAGVPRDSLMIWRAELVKSPYAGRFDRSDPRLSPNAPTTERDLELWRTVREELNFLSDKLSSMATSSPAIASTPGPTEEDDPGPTLHCDPSQGLR